MTDREGEQQSRPLTSNGRFDPQQQILAIAQGLGTPYGHGKLFGAEAAKTGQQRRCPYLPKFTEAIRGWYDGWDGWWAGRPELGTDTQTRERDNEAI